MRKMKFSRWIFGFFLFLITLMPQGGSKSVPPFFDELKPIHPFQMRYSNGGSFTGGGGSSHYGFPFKALIVDRAASGAGAAANLMQADGTFPPSPPPIDSWRFKLDAVKLTANLLLVAFVGLILRKSLGLIQKSRRSQ